MKGTVVALVLSSFLCINCTHGLQAGGMVPGVEQPLPQPPPLLSTATSLKAGIKMLLEGPLATELSNPKSLEIALNRDADKLAHLARLTLNEVMTGNVFRSLVTDPGFVNILLSSRFTRMVVNHETFKFVLQHPTVVQMLSPEMIKTFLNSDALVNFIDPELFKWSLESSPVIQNMFNSKVFNELMNTRTVKHVLKFGMIHHLLHSELGKGLLNQELLLGFLNNPSVSGLLTPDNMGDCLGSPVVDQALQIPLILKAVDSYFVRNVMHPGIRQVWWSSAPVTRISHPDLVEGILNSPALTNAWQRDVIAATAEMPAFKAIFNPESAKKYGGTEVVRNIVKNPEIRAFMVALFETMFGGNN